MKSETMFSFDLLFGDHMAKVSNQAKLYYIKLNFYARNGFVANPMSVLDSLGFDKSVFQELVNNGEILTLPNRCEVFITSYFVHNHFDPKTWLKTPFAQYWKGKLYTKKNGVATFNPQGDEDKDPLDYIKVPKEEEPKQEPNPTKEEWDKLFEPDAPKEETEDEDYPF